MSHDNVYHDTDSSEYKATEKSIRQAIRLLLVQGHAFEPVKLLSSTEVQIACNGVYIPTELLNSIVIPNIDCRDWVWEMYANKQYWSVDEAASLAAAFDPFMFNRISPTFIPVWREKREAIHAQVSRAIKHGELSATSENKIDYVTPHDFCYFALEAGLTHEWATPFFENMGAQTPLTVGGSADILSPPKISRH